MPYLECIFHNQIDQMRKLLLLISLVMLMPSVIKAQPTRTCSTMDVLEIQMQKDPAIQQRMERLEQFTQQYVSRNSSARATGIVTIPVVVHVVYRRGSQNISESQILSQIQVLNEDFRRTNGDQTNTWSQAADTEIEFCLASVDPNGNSTNGITRTSTRKRSFSSTRDDVKFSSSGGKDAWPTDQYLNIWVCDLSNGLLGYAQFPNTGPASTDGVVVDYQYFGTNGTATAPFNLGRTATHEVGHWLNLRHIWGDGPCSVDDYVQDTPLSDAPNYGCASGHVSCSSVDMVENYMDYSDDACMNLFTLDQKTRMRALFAPGGVRESILTSMGCGSVSGPTCNVPGGLNTTGIGDVSATLNWSATTNAVDYTVQHREVGTSNWISANTAATSFNLTGLTACTDYEWRVRTNCAEGMSNFSAAASFSTTGCGGGGGGTGSCEEPTNVQIATSNRSVTISWTAAPSAISYNVRVRQQGSNNWNNFNTTSTAISINGTKKNRTYEYGVQSVCEGTPATSAWVSGTFNTRNNNGAGNRLVQQEEELILYPNPARELLTISWGATSDKPVNLSVVDVTGRVVYQDAGVNSAGGQYQIPVNGWSPGLYLLQISDDSGLLTIERFVVTK